MENEKDEIEKFNPYLGNGRRKKHFFEDILKPILSGLGGIILIGLYILGTYHSCTKHKDDSDLLRYTPIALYRGVEFFWHNDFAGVNWDEKLKEEGAYCIYLLNTPFDESNNPQETNKNIETFSRNISKYPKDKLLALKTVSRLYFKYETTNISDSIKAFRNYLNTKEINYSHSGDIREIENKLKNYLKNEDFEKLKIESNNSENRLKEVLAQLNTLSETELNERIKNVEYSVVYITSKYNSVFKKLFNEDL